MSDFREDARFRRKAGTLVPVSDPDSGALQFGRARPFHDSASRNTARA